MTQKTKRLRFDCDLTEKELADFDQLLSETHRSRKNFAEALLILAIRKFPKGRLLSYSELGEIRDNDDKQSK